MSSIVPLCTIGGAHQPILANDDIASREGYHASVFAPASTQSGH